MGLDAMILTFWMLSFKLAFSVSYFTLIKRLFSYPSVSAVRVVSSAYLRLLIFLPEILIPACDLSSLAFHMMYSAYKLNKQDDNIHHCCTPFLLLLGPYHFCSCCTPFWTSPLFYVWFCYFLTCIQVSQETGKEIWYSHIFKNFPVCMIHMVKGYKHSQWSKSKCFAGIPLLSLSSSKCWQFDLWFLCLF